MLLGITCQHIISMPEAINASVSSQSLVDSESSTCWTEASLRLLSQNMDYIFSYYSSAWEILHVPDLAYKQECMLGVCPQIT